MHLLILALVVIMAGTLLLAKVKKEGLGKFFKFISWFNIILGFLMFIHFIAGGACKMAHHCCKDKQGCNKEMKMNQCGKEMKGSCCFTGRFGDMDDDDGNCRVICVMMNKDMCGDTMKMDGCMPKPGCMNKPGCDTSKACCHKKMMVVKK